MLCMHISGLLLKSDDKRWFIHNFHKLSTLSRCVSPPPQYSYLRQQHSLLCSAVILKQFVIAINNYEGGVFS